MNGSAKSERYVSGERYRSQARYDEDSNNYTKYSRLKRRDELRLVPLIHSKEIFGTRRSSFLQLGFELLPPILDAIGNVLWRRRARRGPFR